MSERYQGWTNHATWAVNLHIQNTEHSQRKAADLTKAARGQAATCEQVKDGIWSIDEARKFLLADALKDWIEDVAVEQWQAPRGDDFAHLLRLDMVTGYLGDVNWHEIAEGYLKG